jgi:hypothetical protein
LVGPYADEPVDLDALPPQAKQDVLDRFASDLEARREPRQRFTHGAAGVNAPVPEPMSPHSPVVSGEVTGRVLTKSSPAPTPHPKDEPITSVVELPPESPSVTPDVEDAALAIAREVWSQGGRPCAYFYERSGRVYVDEYIAHAAVMKWVSVVGDMVLPGTSNPRPMTAVGDVDGPTWGPVGAAAGLFR